MRILADENIHLSIVQALQAQGHDVTWLRIDAPGTPDIEILPMANRQDRTLLTYDTDFGELIFARNVVSEQGVILIRMYGPIDTHIDRLLDVLPQYEDWTDFFTTITAERVRRRRLPGTASDA